MTEQFSGKLYEYFSLKKYFAHVKFCYLIYQDILYPEISHRSLTRSLTLVSALCWSGSYDSRAYPGNTGGESGIHSGSDAMLCTLLCDRLGFSYYNTELNH